MITVAIVGVLAAIALPSYNGYLAKARRAEARGQLVQAAQFMQRFYAANDQYEKDRAGNSVLSATAGVGMPSQLRKSPGDATEATAIYQLNTSITVAGTYAAAVTPNAFTLTMAPITGGVAATDACGMFTLNSLGVRGVTGATATKSRDECWK